MTFKYSVTIAIFMFFFLGMSQKSVLHPNLSYGDHQPGFKVILTTDYSRSFSASKNLENNNKQKQFRPMQICVWYPALKDKSKGQMTFKDYFLLKTSETGEIVVTKKVVDQMITDFVNSDGIDRARLEAEFDAEMKALKEGVSAPGEFPVIVYGPSWWSNAFENATMFEFLASHGYIVVSTPSMGPVSREMPLTRDGIECQARDMEFSLGKIIETGLSNTSQIATMGFSLGGLSNVISAARNKNIKAWIGLDPSIHEAYELFEASPYTQYEKFTIPMLFVNSVGYMNELPFYDRLFYSDAYLVNLPKLKHTDMASFFIKLGMGLDGSDDSRLKTQNLGYELICQYILTFLDGVFKEDLKPELLSSRLQSISSDKNFAGVKSKMSLPKTDELFEAYSSERSDDILVFLNKTNSGGSGQYPEGEMHHLIHLYAESGFSKESVEIMKWLLDNFPQSNYHRVTEFISVQELTKMMHKVFSLNNECNFTYDELNHAGHILSMGKNPEAGIPYFELNMKLRPDNYKAAFNMGVGYFRVSEFERASEYFEKCLVLEPDKRYQDLANNFLRDLEAVSKN
ncbi:hypothetical protein LCM02_12595 [Lutimonas saemankumensis]|uniref:hypothetical protein n=1 Tax=Lutimonas saemankumensis TaxID=483016 RepID=UPI001CD2C711|nr:hypothetical protein [Lutimonas saemankumensis]MCA0933293.1 hypothetical protein [Lutimonas saemankumensis]